MATKYLALLTNIGAAKLAKATALGTKVEITQMAVGDGNGVLPTPNPAQTALVHELRRAPLNMLTVDPANASQIVAEQVVPEDVGGWWIREIGLFDKDGDMVAIANCAETYKPQLQEGSGRVQVIRVILIVSSTEAVTIKIDPSVVLATRKYVDDKIIEVKAYADDLLVDHIEDENPHSQYPLIANALKEMADAGLVDKVLENLGLEESAFGYKNMVVFSNPGVVNWVVPDELRKGRKCYVKVIGGGGSGGRAAGGGGGGGGGVAEKLIDLTEVESVTLTVGNGGIAPAAGTSNIAGTNGGTTSFGSILSATGGTGGATPSGGACGVGIGGDFNTSLGPGNPGSSFSTSFVGGGGGGPGGQGAVDTSTHDGPDAYGPGGGGAGAALGAPAVAGRGGKGGNGVIIIRW
ncbi:phage tail protein [Citrobacter farmeri]|uniref:phage tail protein n=1 Tax=Citrobacter farmeri TaxID=67824 RepID=UPI00292D0F94|nr:phage tail protein [Citrobacter farmeri]